MLEDKKDCGQTATEVNQGCSMGRLSTQELIKIKIKNLHNEIQGLEALHDALPAKLPHKADEALWNILLAKGIA